MASENMIKMINRQINREIYSAYFYLGMASYADLQGYKGIAHWFKIQFKEELQHAEKMYDYVIGQGKRVILEAIETPPQDFSSIKDLFVKTLEHERKVTGLIKDFVAVAAKEHDLQTDSFLQWFVKEQVEEEANPANILKKIADYGSEKKGLSKLDEELAKRK